MRFLRALVLSLALPLTACETLSLPPLLGGPPTGALSLLGGSVSVQAPDGYCVDSRTSKATKGFAILVPCAVLTQEGALPRVSAVIVIQAGSQGSAIVEGSEDALADLLGEAAGASLLSATGTVSDIKVRSVKADSNRVEVLFDDAGNRAIPDTQTEVLRVFTDIQDRLVTVSLRGLSNAPAAIDAKQALLDRAVSKIMQANAS